MRKKDLVFVLGACFLSAVVGGLVSRWVSDSSVLAQWQEPAYDFIDNDTVVVPAGTPAGRVLKYVDPDADDIGSWRPATDEVGGSSYTTKPIKCYPTGAVAVTVTASATAWAWGALGEIVPAGTITSDFIIIGVAVEISGGNVRSWQVEFCKGASGSEVAIAEASGSYGTSTVYPFIEPSSFPIPVKVDASTRITARATNSINEGDSYKVRIYYMELPL